jgi:hypothetical protein
MLPYPEKTTRINRQLRDDAEAWIFSRGERLGPFSFDSVCETLGLNPENYRVGVIEWRKTHIADSRGGRRPGIVRSYADLSGAKRERVDPEADVHPRPSW